MPETGPSLLSRGVAAVILLVAAYILFKVVIGMVAALLFPVLAILAVVGIVWAIGVLR